MTYNASGIIHLSRMAASSPKAPLASRMQPAGSLFGRICKWIRDLVDCPFTTRLNKINDLSSRVFFYEDKQRNKSEKTLGIVVRVQEIQRSGTKFEVVRKWHKEYDKYGTR